MTKKTHKLIAVIPARVGSKRIPGKNITPFKGKPLIVWTIQAAIESQVFDRVVVSTDDRGIADVAQESGAEVPGFRARYNDDHSPVSLATLEGLRQAESMYHEKYTVVAQLMANCPLRTSDDIKAAVEFFYQQQAEAVISCTRFEWLNPWWAITLDKDNRPQALFRDKLTARSQDLPVLYCPTGAIWLARSGALKKHSTFYTRKHIMFPISFRSAIDIDTQADLDMATSMHSLPVSHDSK